MTEKGQDQARQVRAYFEKHDMTFDQYYCTTTERASDTIELATGQTDYQRVKGLKEMHFGIFEGQPVQGHFGDHYVQFGGESQDQFVERVVASAKEIVERHPEQSILAVSHAGALMTFLHAVDPERAFQSCPGNCAILVFDYDGSDFHFVKLIDPLTDQEFVEF